jgi:K+-transporting ATPase ATPase C chain
VARERGLQVARVLQLVAEHTQGRSLGILGEEGVNVLELNLALAELAG